MEETGVHITLVCMSPTIAPCVEACPITAVPDRCQRQRLVIASAALWGATSLAADDGQAVSRIRAA
jgi:hypothetical protein